MRVFSISIGIIILALSGAFYKKNVYTDDTNFRKHIKFNHLFVVVDDSTYKYLFDYLKLPKSFAKTSEQTIDAGNTTWTGKYLHGTANYVEFFRPGGIKGSKVGDFGMGFITNKLGTIQALQTYWTKTLDSVHVENKTITEGGKTTPWFTSVSIPATDSLKISAWVFENTKEEMKYAGFSDSDLLREIEFSDYLKHMSAKMRKIPIDSVKNDQLFSKITSLNVSLSSKELAYFRKFLLDIGFTENNKFFVKEDFKVNYTVAESAHFLLKEVDCLLSKKVPKKKYLSKKINVVVEGITAKILFNYN